ncbi:NXPE family member 1-like [Ambystoma mexicanum]|uniref:NXPE family member 1-like n=1 Tax=Ambystoma mexicanum TaxID=8296 RepID=UPI0037E76447
MLHQNTKATVAIISVYWNPLNIQDKDFLKIIEKSLYHILTELKVDHMIICGDLNARCPSTVDTKHQPKVPAEKRGERWLELMALRRCHNLDKTFPNSNRIPTWESDTCSATIDYIFASENLLKLATSFEIIKTEASDHNLLKATWVVKSSWKRRWSEGQNAKRDVRSGGGLPDETAPVKEKCKTGMEVQFPGGYFLQNVWHPISCSMTRYTAEAEINGCLKGKSLHFIGDSTLIQWITYVNKTLPTLKDLNLYGLGWSKSLLKVDVDRNIQIRFQRHGDPFVSMDFHSIMENPTIPEQIDRIGGHQNTVIIFTAGTHFKGFPLHIYIRRVINIRKAIQRLLLRSPATKVILKTENTAWHANHIEAVSDLHGYFQYLVMNSLMKGLNIATIDAWDMTTAAATNDVHPSPIVIENEISLLLTFLC